jgi:hypothetical protein
MRLVGFMLWRVWGRRFCFVDRLGRIFERSYGLGLIEHLNLSCNR